MNIGEQVHARGQYRIDEYGEDGTFLSSFVFDNLVVQNFFTQVFKALADESAVLNVTHLAVGSETTPAAKTDTALGTETFRKAVSSIVYSATKLTVKTALAASDFVGTWEEIGIVINGTDTLGTGALLSHANLSYIKNASTQLVITYTLTIQ